VKKFARFEHASLLRGSMGRLKRFCSISDRTQLSIKLKMKINLLFWKKLSKSVQKKIACLTDAINIPEDDAILASVKWVFLAIDDYAFFNLCKKKKSFSFKFWSSGLRSSTKTSSLRFIYTSDFRYRMCLAFLSPTCLPWFLITHMSVNYGLLDSFTRGSVFALS
jgi:hypothetical protein